MNLEVSGEVAEALEKLLPAARRAAAAGELLVLTHEQQPLVAVLPILEPDAEAQTSFQSDTFRAILDKARAPQRPALTREEVRARYSLTDEEVTAVDVEALLSQPTE